MIILGVCCLLFAQLVFAVEGSSIPTMKKTTSTPGFNETQKEEIGKVVHQYLLDNPQILRELSEKLEKIEREAARAQALNTIKTNTNEIFNHPDTPVIGNPNGTVHLVEFYDYQCIHCQKEGPIVENLIKKNPQLRVVLKNFPIQGAVSEFAAKALLSAQKQHASVAAFHHALFTPSKPLTNDEVLKIARSVGLDTAKLEQDMDSKQWLQMFQENLGLAEKLGFLGTPSFIIATGIDDPKTMKTFIIPGFANENVLQKLIKHVQGAPTDGKSL